MLYLGGKYLLPLSGAELCLRVSEQGNGYSGAWEVKLGIKES